MTNQKTDHDELRERAARVHDDLLSLGDALTAQGHETHGSEIARVGALTINDLPGPPEQGETDVS